MQVVVNTSKNVKKFVHRTVTSKMHYNVSANWRADWARFAGKKYAQVLQTQSKTDFKPKAYSPVSQEEVYASSPSYMSSNKHIGVILPNADKQVEKGSDPIKLYNITRNQKTFNFNFFKFFIESGLERIISKLFGPTVTLKSQISTSLSQGCGGVYSGRAKIWRHSWSF